MKLLRFYFIGIVSTAFFEMCLFRIYDLMSRPSNQDDDEFNRPTGILKGSPRKAFAYVESNRLPTAAKSRATNKFPKRNAPLRARKKRPDKPSRVGLGGGDPKRIGSGDEVQRKQPVKVVGDGLSLGPPKKRGERRIYTENGLKVPTPIIVLSLPKSGTSSLFQYFTCGGVYAAHTYGLDRVTRKTYRLGERFRKNINKGLPMLTNTEPLNVFTDIGYVNGPQDCFYPSIEALDSIARDYPQATLIVSYRPGWFTSIWNFKLMGKRWKKYCPIFPNTTDEVEWEAYYIQHRKRIRELVQKHPTLHHLEFDLTDPDAGQKLEDFTGISHQCWGDCKPTMKCHFKTPANMTAAAKQ